MDPYLNSEQAAALLGVRRSTLYSYVSRGLIQSLAGKGPHASRFHRSEVERLARQQANRRQPRQAARAALDWGLPVLESGLTLIEDGRLTYRSVALEELLPHAGLEQVAERLWQAECVPATRRFPMSATWQDMARRHSAQTIFERTLPLFTVGQAELARRSTGKDDLAQAWQLLQLMAMCVLGADLSGLPLHAQCAEAWHLDGHGMAIVRTALLCCADHELNASSFTARCIASTGADMGAAVTGALAALSGPLHGGFTERIEALFDELATAGSFKRVLQQKLAQGGALPGFGHPLYPAGDPRARAVLRLLPANRKLNRVVETAQELCGHAPSIDFALIAARRYLGLPRGAAFGMFALARTVGWIAHVLEQRQAPGLIRPRASYVGPRPETAAQGRIIRFGRGPASRGAKPVRG